MKKTAYKILRKAADKLGYELNIARKPTGWPIYDGPETHSTSNPAVTVDPSGPGITHPITSNTPDSPQTPYKDYAQDGLSSIHSNDFLRDAKFIKAYQRGIKAAQGIDFKWHWRVHVGLWAANICRGLEGDYVECGVGNGFLSSAILEYLPWNKLDKHFYLFDTFEGLDSRLVTADELANMGDTESHNLKMVEAGVYARSYQSVETNFGEWERVHLIKGTVPNTLTETPISKICYLHLDMNCVTPEIAALEYFYPKLSSGAVVLLDDYAYCGYSEQKKGYDLWTKKSGVEILSLPTGQGLLIKNGG